MSNHLQNNIRATILATLPLPLPPKGKKQEEKHRCQKGMFSHNEDAEIKHA
jgi:hypothetical protein